jgi:hypothetical protein
VIVVMAFVIAMRCFKCPPARKNRTKPTNCPRNVTSLAINYSTYESSTIILVPEEDVTKVRGRPAQPQQCHSA